MTLASSEMDSASLAKLSCCGRCHSSLSSLRSPDAPPAGTLRQIDHEIDDLISKNMAPYGMPAQVLPILVFHIFFALPFHLVQDYGIPEDGIDDRHRAYGVRAGVCGPVLADPSRSTTNLIFCFCLKRKDGEASRRGPRVIYRGVYPMPRV